jgi:hypothetical protein
MVAVGLGASRAAVILVGVRACAASCALLPVPVSRVPPVLSVECARDDSVFVSLQSRPCQTERRSLIARGRRGLVRQDNAGTKSRHRAEQGGGQGSRSGAGGGL